MAATDLAASRTAHYGTKPGHFETSKIHFPTSEGVSEVSEWTSERSGGRERISSPEQANEWAVGENEQTDERVAQYFSLDSWLFWPTVQWPDDDDDDDDDDT